MSDVENPLTDQDYKKLIEVMKSTDKTIKAINKAKAAGIDTGDQLAQVNAAREQATKMLRTYFPNRPMS